MPVSRRRPRGRTIKTLDSFGLDEILCFQVAWSPQENAHWRRWRWQTWGEFLSDYAAVRAELFAGDWGDVSSWFAEWIFARYGTKVPPAMQALVPGPYPASLPEPRLLVEWRNDRRKDDR